MELPLYLKWEILFWVWAVTVPSRQVSLPHVCTGCFSSVDLSSCDTVMHWYWVLGAAVVSVQYNSIHRWYPYIQIGISTTSSVLCVYVLVCVPWRYSSSMSMIVVGLSNPTLTKWMYLCMTCMFLLSGIKHTVDLLFANNRKSLALWVQTMLTRRWQTDENTLTTFMAVH